MDNLPTQPVPAPPPPPEGPPLAIEKLRALLKSRKFWALLLAVLSTVEAHATGQITGWQMTEAIVISLAAYMGATAIDDAGASIGRKK